MVGVGDLDVLCQPKHLLWCLFFLKSYTSENAVAASVGADEKTFRKWFWYVIGCLNDLEQDLVSSRKKIR